MTQSEDKKHEWGRVGEEMAMEYLLTHGYTIRERNFQARNTHLETDIIAQIGNTIVFCEVKSRHPDYEEDAVRAINKTKRSKLIRAARIYLNALDQDYDYRFDVITVIGTSRADAKLDHIPDAFLPF